ncbi:MAG: hypothetical protein ABI678_25440, partial [Kofleriaceae bacterium]
MRAPIVIALLLAAGPSRADDEPAISADGSRIELHEAEYRLCGGASTTVFCDAGADVDDGCTRHRIVSPCDRGDRDSTGPAASEKVIADIHRAGGFKPLPVISLHRIVQHEMLGPQEVTRARVTRTSGGLTITVAAGAKLSTTIAVTRGKRKIAAARWSCESYGGDQAAIT